MSLPLSVEKTYEFDVEDHVYNHDDGQDFLARVYRPIGEGPFPTVLNIHGGVWVRPDRTRNNELSETLASRGVLTVGIDIHVPPQGTYPSSMQDVNLAVRWLKAHAAEFGGTESIGAIGTSSGGHQVQLVAIQPRHPVYSALSGPDGVDATLDYVIAAWPIPDVTWRYHLVKENGPDLYIRGHEAFWLTEEAMTEGSPQHILDTSTDDTAVGGGIVTPPMQVIHRKDDELHPREMQDRYVESYRAHGGEVEFVEIADLPQVFTMSPEGEQMLEVVLDYISRHA